MQDRSLVLANQYNQKNLLKKIFESEVPEKYAKELPAQTLFLTIKQNGLPDSIELIDICSIEQLQIFLDLDCWNGDNFDEEKFWTWLELPDASGEEINQEILTKILKAFDLKLLGNLLCRYVNIINYDEPTDEPPAGDYFTPDRGHTWINVFIPDPHRNFLLNRFLASVFELSIEIFYQVLTIPTIATPSQLEEDSYQDRKKRLEAEGFPAFERSLELNTPLSLDQIKRKEPENKKPTKQSESTSIEKIRDGALLPLELLWHSSLDIDELNGEFNLLLNSALIRWNISLDDHEQILFIAKQVRGSINIGLELVIEELALTPIEAYHQHFLQDLYRLGLNELYKISKLAKKLPEERLKQISTNNSELFEAIAGALEDIPQKAISQMEEVERVTTYVAFEHLTELTDYTKQYLVFPNKNR